VGLGALAQDPSGDAGAPFAVTGDGLRVIARRAGDENPVPELVGTLERLRGLHALTVLDCGTVSTPGAELAVETATCVVWTVGSAPDAEHHVRRELSPSGPAPAPTGAPEMLAAVATDRQAGLVAARALRDAAVDRCERVVFLPWDARAAGGLPPGPGGGLVSALGATLSFVASAR
jgi:hypothetical protein